MRRLRAHRNQGANADPADHLEAAFDLRDGLNLLYLLIGPGDLYRPNESTIADGNDRDYFGFLERTDVLLTCECVNEFVYVFAEPIDDNGNAARLKNTLQLRTRNNSYAHAQHTCSHRCLPNLSHDPLLPTHNTIIPEYPTPKTQYPTPNKNTPATLSLGGGKEFLRLTALLEL